MTRSHRTRFEPLLRGRFGRPYLYEPECESTQHLLVERCARGCGRRDRPPDCRPRTPGPPSGKLRRELRCLCSIALHPPADRPRPQLSLVAGVAVADTLERTLGLAVQIKWPNDVMLNRRKVAGVLAEARGGTWSSWAWGSTSTRRATSCPSGQAPSARSRAASGNGRRCSRRCSWISRSRTTSGARAVSDGSLRAARLEGFPARSSRRRRRHERDG